MKTLNTLKIAAFVLALGAIAKADDNQLSNRLAVQRASADANGQTVTIGAYVNGRSVSRDSTLLLSHRGDAQFELRSNAQGQQFGLYAPSK